MHCVFYFKRPKKSKADAVWFTGRPDGDNLIKQIKDALNEVIFHDDSQVVKGTFEKRYSDMEYSTVEILEL